MGVIVWVRKAVCGWGSLDCCRKVCVCVLGGGRGDGVGVCVEVIAWVRKAVCGWGSLDCCRKVHLHVYVCVCVCVGGGGGRQYVGGEALIASVKYCMCVCGGGRGGEGEGAVCVNVWMWV